MLDQHPQPTKAQLASMEGGDLIGITRIPPRQVSL
jgi:hypothetical protein